MSERDVIVVGAGPVGLTLAALLADSGVKVTVVEARAIAGDQPRAISVVDETFRTMQQLGLDEALKAESHLDTGSKYFGLGDRLLATAKPGTSKLGHPGKSQFDQPVLEELLWDKAVADDRIDFRMSTEALALVQDTGGVTLSVERDGEREELRAAWLVGCDGGRSFVRGAIDIDLVGSTQVEKWIVVDLLGSERPVEPYAEFHCDATRPHVIVPGIKGRLRFEFMLLPGEDEEELTRFERIRELCRPYLDITPEQVRRSAVYVAHQRLARHYRKARVFLAGDAAHLMPPFAGQGLNAGIRDAGNLAWKLAEAVHGRATQELLDSYEGERRAHAADMVRISARIGQIVMTTGHARAVARDAVVQGLRVLPNVKSWLAGMKFINPPAYLGIGCAVAPAKDVDPELAALVGRSLPQPEVRDADGETFRLDDRLNGGWTLLAVGGGLGLDPFARLDPAWDSIASSKLAIRRRDTLLGKDSGIPEVSDVSGYLAHRGKPIGVANYLLVRPDKYVAAAFTSSGEAGALAGIRAFIVNEPALRK